MQGNRNYIRLVYRSGWLGLLNIPLPLSHKYSANNKSMEKIHPSPRLVKYTPGKGYIVGILAFKEEL